MTIGHSRALPGHRIYLVERFGGCNTAAADDAMLSALADIVRRDPRCLRVVVEVFERDREIRARLTESLERFGFSRAPKIRMYERTLGIELRRPSQELFASLHPTARRNIRNPAKRGLELRRITDTSLAPRLGELVRLTFRRTAAAHRQRPWKEIIELSTDSPSVSRVVGLFDPRLSGADSLLAFAWGCLNGSYATYEEGASLRASSLGGTALGYAPLWDIIAWANEETPAAWFDLGGVTAGGPGDTQWGISEFKRYFSRDVIDVGDEWLIEPSKVRAAIARGVSDAAHWFDSIWRGSNDQSAPASAPARSAGRGTDSRSASAVPAFSALQPPGRLSGGPA